jgi:predicted outer membrane repeat protein
VIANNQAKIGPFGNNGFNGLGGGVFNQGSFYMIGGGLGSWGAPLAGNSADANGGGIYSSEADSVQPLTR